MEPIEITAEEDDCSSEIEYTNFRRGDMLDSLQELRQEVRAEALARQFQSETSRSCCRPSCSFWRCVKVSVLTMVITFIWLALTVPTVYYIVRLVSCKLGGSWLSKMATTIADRVWRRVC